MGMVFANQQAKLERLGDPTLQDTSVHVHRRSWLYLKHVCP